MSYSRARIWKFPKFFQIRKLLCDYRLNSDDKNIHRSTKARTHPRGTPTCTERFPNMLVHTILDEWTDGFDEIEEVDLCILDIAPSNRTTHKRWPDYFGWLGKNSPKLRRRSWSSRCYWKTSSLRSNSKYERIALCTWLGRIREPKLDISSVLGSTFKAYCLSSVPPITRLVKLAPFFIII